MFLVLRSYIVSHQIVSSGFRSRRFAIGTVFDRLIRNEPVLGIGRGGTELGLLVDLRTSLMDLESKVLE